VARHVDEHSDSAGRSSARVLAQRGHPHLPGSAAGLVATLKHAASMPNPLGTISPRGLADRLRTLALQGGQPAGGDRTTNRRREVPLTFKGPRSPVARSDMTSCPAVPMVSIGLGKVHGGPSRSHRLPLMSQKTATRP